MEFSLLPARLILSAVFLLAGSTKFVDLAGFRKVVHHRLGLVDDDAVPKVAIVIGAELRVRERR